MAEQKDKLAELRHLAETVLKTSALDAAGIDAYMAYVHATEARTVLKLLAVVEAAKVMRKHVNGSEQGFAACEELDAAFAALEQRP